MSWVVMILISWGARDPHTLLDPTPFRRAPKERAPYWREEEGSRICVCVGRRLPGRRVAGSRKKVDSKIILTTTKTTPILTSLLFPGPEGKGRGPLRKKGRNNIWSSLWWDYFSVPFFSATWRPTGQGVGPRPYTPPFREDPICAPRTHRIFL